MLDSLGERVSDTGPKQLSKQTARETNEMRPVAKGAGKYIYRCISYGLLPRCMDLTGHFETVVARGDTPLCVNSWRVFETQCGSRVCGIQSSTRYRW